MTKNRFGKAVNLLITGMILTTVAGGNPVWAKQLSKTADQENQSIINFEDLVPEARSLTNSYQGCNFGNIGWNTGKNGDHSVELWADNMTTTQQVNKIAIPYGKIFKGFSARCTKTAQVEVKAGGMSKTFTIDSTKKAYTTDFTDTPMGVYIIITNKDGANDVKFDDIILEDGIAGRVNLSQSKPVKTSGNNSQAAENGNDGNPNTMWVNNGDGVDKWWQVDLGNAYDLDEFELTFEKEESKNPWKYKIEGSTDGSVFTVISDRTSNTDGAKIQTGTFDTTSKYRYVRVTITGLPNDSYWCAFAEFKVFTNNIYTNMALNKKAAQSAGSNSASFAVDGNAKTFSGNTGTFPYWLTVDLGKSYDIKKLEIEWEDLKEGDTDIPEDWKYTIEYSSDKGKTWNTAVDYSTASPYTDPATSVVQSKEVNITCDQLRVTILDKPTKRPGAWAIIPEFRAYAVDDSVMKEAGQFINTNLAYYKPVTASFKEGAFLPENITDDKEETSWAHKGNTKDQWFQIDLGNMYDLTRSTIQFKDESIAKQYKILVSTDKKVWKEVWDAQASTNTNSTITDLYQASGRYIKVELGESIASLEVSDFKVEGTKSAVEPRKILILAPHEDDETLMAGGIIRSAIENGDQVKVLLATNGDYNGQSSGQNRIHEAVTSLAHLGLTKDDILFLGYADTGGLGGTQTYEDSFLYKMYIGQDDEVLKSRWNNQKTYGAPNFKEDYHFEKTGEHADYTRANFLGDMQSVIKDFAPDDIYVPSRYDMHFDHAYIDLFAIEAVLNIRKEDKTFHPIMHESIIHSCAGDNNWPELNDDKKGILPMKMPAGLETLTMFDWDQRESITVPYAMRQTPFAYNQKDQALRLYVSQYYGYIGSFAKFDEVFWTRDFSSIGPEATVTASSESVHSDRVSDQSARKAVDGVLDGYATGLSYGHTRFPHGEWKSVNEKAGAWINLEWDSPKTINKVVLYDRPNQTDHILGGTLVFGDGSSVKVGSLSNDGRPVEIGFEPRSVSSVKFVVDSVSDSTTNVGLAEFEVFLD